MFNFVCRPAHPTAFASGPAKYGTATRGRRLLDRRQYADAIDQFRLRGGLLDRDGGQAALLNWITFKRWQEHDRQFRQGASTWVALNRIMDPSGSPSQILGQINAPGQVYVINQNGIIFGGSSQINVGSLIASSLDITSQSNFLSGVGFVSTGIKDTTPSFSGSSTSGQVTIQAGAQLSAPNGNVLLLGPIVENDGAINTPSGQTLLLGGSDVLLANGDSHLRGFVVSNNPNYANPNVLGSYYASKTPGVVINNGSISASEGNITIVAGQVSQNGVLTSTTSTTKNGSIIIWAEAAALVLGGPNDNPLYALYGVAAQPSLVQILPDATDQSQITGTQTITNSAIALTGTDVDVRGIVQLRGYDVTNANNLLATASGPLNNPIQGTGSISTGVTITATGTTVTSAGSPQNLGQVFLENGSLLDTAGTTDAVASASRNSVAVELRTNELADSPLLRESPLYQQTIYVDASVFGTNAGGTTWQGTAIANASGWIGLTTRSLDERLMNGAPISIGGIVYPQSGSASAVNLVQSSGSAINVSGGYMTYTPGFVRVSRLVDQYGRIVSVSNADPNDVYVGICCSFSQSHAHWGVIESFCKPAHGRGLS
jgi:filamentous hemagglutinin family protein